jgi:voltage-gated potassium channel Kch
VISPTWTERLRYKFDNFMSKGTAALIGGLGVLSLALIFLAALIISAGNIRPDGAGDRLGFFEAAWESLMRTLDAGTMGGDAGWSFRLVMFAVTLGGVFIISTLIGLLTSGIEAKTEQLRKGRSRIIESGHTVILGWSPQIFCVVSELALANQNQKDACLVILAPRDKLQMEDELREKVENTGRTRIVCRSGDPIDLSDLGIVSLPASKSIIILSPESEYPDADAIKTLVAVLHSSDRRSEAYHIVVELQNEKNLEVARLVGKQEAELVLVSDLISRIIAQTCLQSGLSVVYNELLDFSGDEIYFKEEPALVGKSFAEALLAYEDSSVIGYQPKGGTVKLNPPMETRLAPGDRLIAISEDDDTVILSGLVDLEIQETAITPAPASTKKAEKILVLGWNRQAARILHEIDYYVIPGSTITIVADGPELEEVISKCCPALKNLTISFVRGDISDRPTLEGLGLAGFSRIILLAYSDQLEVQRADALTLVTLLHLRTLADQHGYSYAIVSQILDVRNRSLAEVTRADDFIVSDKLASLMVSQVAENKFMNAVFADIFDPEGSEIYLKPARDYVPLHQPVNFYTVVQSAVQRSQVAIGYRLKAASQEANQGYGVVVNPDKSVRLSFSENDQIIVLAED